MPLKTMHPLFTIATASDSYKVTHAQQYPADTHTVYSHCVARSTPEGWDDEIVFYGLQYVLHYLEGAIVTKAVIDEAEEEWNAHFGRPGYFNRKGWEYILKKHGGRLPVSIRAVPEGTVIGKRNVLFDIENTDKSNPNTAWLTNWLETLLCQTWYPTTVATQSRLMKKRLYAALRKTGTPESLPFKLHDFGFRGVSCFEQAAIGGSAHLVNFQGTDSFAGVRLARSYYDADMPGFSIPASEHSTVTINGSEGECEFFEKMLDIYPDDQIVACVSDSYDIMRAIREYWGGALKDKILARKAPLVIRPDSSKDPVHVAVLNYLQAAGEVFGCSLNDKGYRVLPDQVRLIQGDGIDFHSFHKTVEALELSKWSLDNIAFGSGGGLLQQVNRDTLGFAIKCSYAEGPGWSADVFKSPVGMPMKRSMKGRLRLVRTGSNYSPGPFTTIRADSLDASPNELVEVFRDGEIVIKHTFDEVRARASLDLNGNDYFGDSA